MFGWILGSFFKVGVEVEMGLLDKWGYGCVGGGVVVCVFFFMY